MKSDTEKYLHEARTHGAQLADAVTRNGSLTVGQVESLTKHVYEYAIKAPIAENPTGVSKKYQSHSLQDLSSRYGLWSELPANLQGAITEMDRFYPAYPNSVQYTTLVSSTSATQWQNRIEKGRELIDFVEGAIKDPARFSKFKF